MKKLILILSVMLLSIVTFAQLQVHMDVTNITTYGGFDGNIKLTIDKGVSVKPPTLLPYTVILYEKSEQNQSTIIATHTVDEVEGVASTEFTNLPAGNYWEWVKDSNIPSKQVIMGDRLIEQPLQANGIRVDVQTGTLYDLTTASKDVSVPKTTLISIPDEYFKFAKTFLNGRLTGKLDLRQTTVGLVKWIKTQR